MNPSGGLESKGVLLDLLLYCIMLISEKKVKAMLNKAQDSLSKKSRHL